MKEQESQAPVPSSSADRQATSPSAKDPKLQAAFPEAKGENGESLTGQCASEDSAKKEEEKKPPSSEDDALSALKKGLDAFKENLMAALPAGLLEAVHLPSAPSLSFGQKKKDEEEDEARDEGKKMFLFAGVNGTGKTSLYATLKNKMNFGRRVSVDDIAKRLGDWRDPTVQVRAGCVALKEAKTCIAAGQSFNQETTLPGAVIVKQLKAAKEAGFFITLYFVGVNGVEISIDRVKKRVEKGGHGISEEVIRKRYNTMPDALSRVLPYCDRAFFYDNTEMFRQIACYENGEFTDLDADLPAWFYFVTGHFSQNG